MATICQLHADLRYYLCLEPVDMRKQFHGAAGNSKCGIREIPYAGRGLHFYRERQEDGEDTSPREQRPDDVCEEAGDREIPDTVPEPGQAYMHCKLP